MMSSNSDLVIMAKYSASVFLPCSILRYKISSKLYAPSPVPFRICSIARVVLTEEKR